MTAQQLKNAILQEAIEGRLVPQDPNDEPASVLLNRIREEKKRLVKEKAIVLSKPEKACKMKDEGDFLIPDNWKWAMVNDVCRVFGRIGFRGYTTEDLRATKDNAAISISPSNMINGTMDFTKCTYISEEKYEESPEIKIENGDILIVKTGSSYGKTSLVKNLPWKSTINPQIAVVKNISIERRFLLYYFQTPYVQSKFNEFVLGTSIPTFSQLNLISMQIPLPPLAEQKRIVAKIEELLPKVEKYGKAQEELNKLNAELPERLKKSILQEAIEGRLVKQDSNDEPASVLLDKIREEKKQLVKAGKLKKKDLEETPIPEDEIPFEIPESWEWVKLSFITSLIDGEKKEGNYVCLDAKFLRGKSSGEIQAKGKFVKQNDNIILVDGENSGEVFKVPCDGYMGSTFKQLWVSESLYLPYVLFFIKFYKDILRNSKKGAAIPHLNKEIFNNLVVGIPPLAEQKRIVEKIEQLFKEVDKLKA